MMSTKLGAGKIVAVHLTGQCPLSSPRHDKSIALPRWNRSRRW